MFSKSDLLPALRRYWGYSSFRPMQERIVRSLLGGHDACVVMPTGGGKSLCYQLPAALSPGKTAVVISPLIALMQDQVAQLSRMGIPSEFLNSSKPASDQTRIMQKAAQAGFRLLYLSPERIARGDTPGWLQSVPVAFFVIDEAHCISEWGHEFRPEYRQLSRLRDLFPDRPIAAFTASATRRVRHDVIEQLRLREPHKFISSFHRPNLHYVVRQCDALTQRELLLQALRSQPHGSIIVYAPTIAKVESTADFLEEQGIPAVTYHGKMESSVRRANQERWMSDDVRVLVGTIAFGLGINKPGVRAVIHLSLPKSVEQYYQEAGRAGRDGQPALCLLLWQRQDSALLSHFVRLIEDPAESERAWQRYRDIHRFVESKSCRHLLICRHFGESPRWASCRACDACGVLPDWLPPRESVDLPPPVPRAAKKRRRRTEALPATSPAPEPALLEYLRAWRRELSKREGLPAFVVLHDTTLEELCRLQPHSLAELMRVPGIGERKAQTYGAQILDAIARFRKGARAAPTQTAPPSPAEETLRLIAEGRTLEEVARLRSRTLSTVVEQVCRLVEAGELKFDPRWISGGRQALIEEACNRLGWARTRPIKDALPPEVTYGEIRLVIARLRRLGQQRTLSQSAG